MHHRSISQRVRTLLFALIIACIAALAATSSASAAPQHRCTIITCLPAPQYAPANYTGWVRIVEFTRCADPLRNCGDGYRPLGASVAGWQWTGSAWRAASVPTFASVYVTPYAAGWTWAWTHSTGWVALSTSGAYRFALPR